MQTTGWSPVSSQEDESDCIARAGCALQGMTDRAPRKHMGIKRPNRVSWADMVSDDSDSTPDWGDVMGSMASASPAIGSSAGVASSGSVTATSDAAVGDTCCVDTTELWATEVRGLAEKLSVLANAAPCTGPEVRDAGTSTELLMGDVARWMESAKLLEQSLLRVSELQSEAAQARLKVSEQQSECATACEAVHTATRQGQHAKAKALETFMLEHQSSAAMIASTTASVASARSALDSALDESRGQADAWRDIYSSLTEEMRSSEKKYADAEASALNALEARELVDAMPSNDEKCRALEARATRAAKESKKLRGSIDSTRHEFTTVQATAAAKTDGLEKRIAQLEQECRELQARDEEGEIQPPAANEEALRLAQESNHHLLKQVRQVRHDRDQQCKDLQRLEADIAFMREHCSQASLACADLQLQHCDLAQRETSARAEVTRLHEQIQCYEDQAKAADDAAIQAGARHSEVDATKRKLLLVRRHAEEAASVSEWELQRAVAQLNREAPGTPLVRCLLPPRAISGSGSTSTHLCLRPPPRAKRLGGQLRPGGSRAEADAESTTAGESVADGLFAEDMLADAVP